MSVSETFDVQAETKKKVERSTRKSPLVVFRELTYKVQVLEFDARFESSMQEKKKREKQFTDIICTYTN